MAHTDDPYKGSWAGVTGRLDKLTDQIEYVRAIPSDSPEKWEALIFSVGMLRDLLENEVLDLREMFPDKEV